MPNIKGGKSTDAVEVSLSKLVYGGEAMGRLPDGRAVFVPYALPGEIVRIHLVEEKRGYARGELVEVVTPSPDRITPRCFHFGECGGCHYQHIPYETQLEIKAAVLCDQLERIGRMVDPPVQPTVSAPAPWAYRNHLQFHLTHDGKLGFHASRSTRVIPLIECHLPEEPLQRIWPLLEVDPIPTLERVSLRLGAGEDILVGLESGDPEPFEFSVDMPLSAIHLGPAGPKVLAGREYVVFQILGRPFRVSAESFFQVNSLLTGAMVEHVLTHLDLSLEDTAVDVYSGVGLFSAFLAPRVGRLIAIESSPSACDDFILNLDEFEHVELYHGPAEAVVPYLEHEVKTVLVDPPRVGLSRQVLDGLLDLSPATIVYISCDPATLARDARRLMEGGYRPNQITPFDLFPQTYHIESISFWLK